MNNNNQSKFFSYSNKGSSRPKIIEKYGNNLKSIFDRIPKEVLREMPVIENSRNFKRKPYINGIRKNKKPELIPIEQGMDNSEQKVISEINNFKEIFYDYNKEQNEHMNNFEKIQKENDQFSKIYGKIQKDKGKFNTGTYLDYKPFINIASRYLSRNQKVPNLSIEHNIFSGNPLILSGSDLEDFIIYNLGDRKKAVVFLEKVDDIINRKKTGNTKLTYQEMERLEKLMKEEKHKGYLPPEILIPKLQNEIIQSQETCKNLNEFENFFKFDGKKKLRLNNFSSYKSASRSSDNIFNNINNKNTINFSSTNAKNNLHLNKRKYIVYKSILENNLTGSTGILGSGKSSLQELSKDFSGNTNMSGILSGRNSTSLKFSPISSPHERQIFNNQNNESILTNRRNKSKIIFQNNFNLMPKTFDFPPTIERNIIKLKKKSILKNNILNEKKKSIKIKNSENSSFIKDNSIFNDKKDINISYVSERGELSDLINNIEEKNIINNNNVNEKEEKEEIHNNSEGNKKLIEDNENLEINSPINKIKDNNEMNTPKNRRYLRSLKSKIFKPRTPTKKERENINYKKVENLFNQALNIKFNSNKDRSELEEYVISKGKTLNKKITTKDTYFNIFQTKEKTINNNLILEEYMIRNGTNDKKSLTSKQNSILNKNNHFVNLMINYELKFKEMLCEETMEK